MRGPQVEELSAAVADKKVAEVRAATTAPEMCRGGRGPLFLNLPMVPKPLIPNHKPCPSSMPYRFPAYCFSQHLCRLSCLHAIYICIFMDAPKPCVGYLGDRGTNAGSRGLIGGHSLVLCLFFESPHWCMGSALQCFYIASTPEYVAV